MEDVTFKVTGFDNPPRRSVPSGGRTGWKDPDAGTHGGEPAHLIFANVKGLRLRDVGVVLEAKDDAMDRSAVFAAHVEDMEVRGFKGRQSRIDGKQPTLRLVDCKEVRISDCRSDPDTGIYLGVEGVETRDVSLEGNDLRTARQTVELAGGVHREQVHHTENREAGWWGITGV